MVTEEIAVKLMEVAREGVFGGRGWYEFKGSIVWVFPAVLVERTDLPRPGEDVKRGRGRPRHSYCKTPEGNIVRIKPKALLWVGSPYEPYPRPNEASDYCSCGSGMFLIVGDKAICIFCGSFGMRDLIRNGSEHTELPML